MTATKPRRRSSAATSVLVPPARRTIAIAAATAVGTVAAAVFGALKLGWLDRAIGPGDAGHTAPDLSADAPTPGTDRAPDAFRPDPTASIPAGERDALRPATEASPTLAGSRRETANQTGIAHG